jgi:hypothetical protein
MVSPKIKLGTPSHSFKRSTASFGPLQIKITKIISPENSNISEKFIKFRKKSTQTTARARPTEAQLTQEERVLFLITSGILPL